MVNFPWLPADEYDFRAVPKPECRFVCFWEYVRSIRTINPKIPSQVIEWIRGKDGKGGVGAGLKTGWYICSRAEDLALPYLTIDKIVFMPFSMDDLANASAFVSKLRRSGDPVSRYLWEQLRESTRQQLTANSGASRPAPKALADLVDDVGKVLRSDKFFDEERFKDVPLRGETREGFARHSRDELEWLYPRSPKELPLYNRWLLAETYPDEIKRRSLPSLATGRSERLAKAYPNEIKHSQPLRPLDWRLDRHVSRATVMVPMPHIKRNIIEKIQDGDDPVDVIEGALRDEDYYFSGDFPRGGTRKIIEEFKKWVVKEAKKFPRPPRGMGAAAPYEQLKWLAAYRLDKVRKEHGLSVVSMMDKLRQSEEERPIHRPTKNLPLYQTEAGWSNAKGDAMSLLDLLESDPAAFEKRMLF